MRLAKIRSEMIPGMGAYLQYGYAIDFEPPFAPFVHGQLNEIDATLLRIEGAWDPEPLKRMFKGLSWTPPSFPPEKVEPPEGRVCPQVSPPRDSEPSVLQTEQFLRSIVSPDPISFEIVGLGDEIVIQFQSTPATIKSIEQQLAVQFPRTRLSVDRLQRPAVSGRTELIYALWKAGAKALIASSHGAESFVPWNPSRNRVKTERLDHELALIRFRLAMDKAVANTPGVGWLFWKTREELAVQKNLDLISAGGVRGGKFKLMPDAFSALQTPKGKTACFVEIDRGTKAGRSVFRRKLLAYELAFKRGVVEKAFGFKTFRVLTVADTESRMEQLLRLAEGMKHPLLFWFASQASTEAEPCLTTPLWQISTMHNSPTALYEPSH